MNRSNYLEITKEKFKDIFNNDKLFNVYKCKTGIYRAINYEVLDEYHPNIPECDKILIVTANWKLNNDEEFLEELTFRFDFTPLLLDIEESGVLNVDYFKEQNFSYEEKIQVMVWLLQKYNIDLTENSESINWLGVAKSRDIVVIDNHNSADNEVKFNSKMLPYPDRNEVEHERNIVYVLKGRKDESIKSLFPGYEIIEIESDNIKDAFNNEWLNQNYLFLLDDTRNKLNIQMADSVLIPGFYDIRALRYEDPRLNKNNQPYGYDLPYQIIGIGHWMPLEEGIDKDILEFNKRHTIEVRLNPIFNAHSEINGLAPDFPMEKRVDTFYYIVRSAFIKINSIEFSEEYSSYKIDSEAIPINEKVENI
ncbi:hypothetical protein [Pleomorphovibrio marinus]|uniref:hypothetical protein n=1 Tax=Pleomorphovibrio marinus TaxID=2164132 RepID=UPI000E0AC34F|nr:hypothetical protein [Pleomorphovibrio marinus]